VEPEKPALKSKSGSEKNAGPLRPTKRQVLWAIGMVVALLTTALLIVNLYPEIWKGLLEERNLTLIAMVVSVTAIIVLLAIGGAASSWTGFRGKTVWDWLQLLIIPLMLGVIGFYFTSSLEYAQQQELEARRAKAERALEEQRLQNAALQTYLAGMRELLLDKNLRASEEDSEIRAVALDSSTTESGGPGNSHPVLV
jgi:small-conductance mechanosensitive channel